MDRWTLKMIRLGFEKLIFFFVAFLVRSPVRYRRYFQSNRFLLLLSVFKKASSRFNRTFVPTSAKKPFRASFGWQIENTSFQVPLSVTPPISKFLGLRSTIHIKPQGDLTFKRPLIELKPNVDANVSSLIFLGRIFKVY